VLLRNHLQRERKRLDHRSKRDDEVRPLLPFASIIADLDRVRRQMEPRATIPSSPGGPPTPTKRPTRSCRSTPTRSATSSSDPRKATTTSSATRSAAKHSWTSWRTNLSSTRPRS
jgi:hypothetical protein